MLTVQTCWYVSVPPFVLGQRQPCQWRKLPTGRCTMQCNITRGKQHLCTHHIFLMTDHGRTRFSVLGRQFPLIHLITQSSQTVYCSATGVPATIGPSILDRSYSHVVSSVRSCKISEECWWVHHPVAHTVTMGPCKHSCDRSKFGNSWTSCQRFRRRLRLRAGLETSGLTSWSHWEHFFEWI